MNVAVFTVTGSSPHKPGTIERRIRKNADAVLIADCNLLQNQIAIRYSTNTRTDSKVTTETTRLIHECGLIVENIIDYNDCPPKHLLHTFETSD